MLLRLPLLCAALALACDAGPAGLPVEERVRAIEAEDRASTPPLYQYMYDSAFLPEVQAQEQATRILLWLRYVDLHTEQLQLLLKLHGRAGVLAERLEQNQRRIVERYEPQLAPAYGRIFDLLAEGAPLDDPRFEVEAAELMEKRTNRVRDDELMAVRIQSVRALLEEEQALLRTLSAQQEARLPDVIFALRRQLDMAANSGDFKVLVGSLYSVGDPTLLLHGDFDPARQHLDIGGLWADTSTELTGPALHQARRELLLYLLLQEPALPTAVEAALPHARQGPAGMAPSIGAGADPERPEPTPPVLTPPTR
ncbi:MAG: hypothetical protein ABIO70_30110 [Pseudomonadota bacterium]